MIDPWGRVRRRRPPVGWQPMLRKSERWTQAERIAWVDRGLKSGRLRADGTRHWEAPVVAGPCNVDGWCDD